VAKRRALGRTDSTINRELQILGQALRLTVQNVRVPFVPTMRRLPGEKDNAREGFFEAADFHAVVAALPEHLQDVARFGYITGWRKGEIVGLRWSAVNRTSGIITLPRRSAKNNKSRTMPVAADLMPLIERRWAARVITREDGTTTMADYVFHHAGQPIGDFRKAWRTACKTAGVSGRLFHDLRRTAVRDMVLHSGVPEVVAMSISGHRTRSVFDRYTISAEDNKRAALTARQAYAAGAAEGPPTRTVAVLPVPAQRVKKAAQRA
jgi:integrase